MIDRGDECAGRTLSARAPSTRPRRPGSGGRGDRRRSSARDAVGRTGSPAGAVVPGRVPTVAATLSGHPFREPGSECDVVGHRTSARVHSYSFLRSRRTSDPVCPGRHRRHQPMESQVAAGRPQRERQRARPMASGCVIRSKVPARAPVASSDQACADIGLCGRAGTEHGVGAAPSRVRMRVVTEGGRGRPRGRSGTPPRGAAQGFEGSNRARPRQSVFENAFVRCPLSYATR